MKKTSLLNGGGAGRWKAVFTRQPTAPSPSLIEEGNQAVFTFFLAVSHVFGYDPGFPINALQESVGFVVTHETLFRSVEHELSIP